MARDAPASGIASEMAAAFYAVRLEDLPGAVVGHLRTLVVDAIACIHAAPPALLDLAERIACPTGDDGGPSVVLPTGAARSPVVAAVVNGALLRSRDLMDVYAGSDVCHPSEALPSILAAGQAVGCSGRRFLETLAAAFMLHVRLSEALPMHRLGFHHTGHAALVVPLALARMNGLPPRLAAEALNLASAGMLVPEGFSRGQVTNLKTFAYGLQARSAFDAVAMARSGLRGSARMLDEMLAVWAKAAGSPVDARQLTSPLEPEAIGRIWLKRYPAQYALQPLIAAAISLAADDRDAAARIVRIEVGASRRTIDRCADPAKYAPANAEAADHSLPFCIAAALTDAGFDAGSLEDRRWLDAGVARMMSLVKTEILDDTGGYEVGRQTLRCILDNGDTRELPPVYPPAGMSWWEIAEEKLRRHARHSLDIDRLLEAVESMESEPTLAGLAPIRA